ncbi:MAG TPA: hypothetical protein VGY14_00495 [Methyloceanibacter sp.]|jgi:hypothetical protein|nr:hypothetical protein [Methyloceanibacter sp.]
MRRRAGLVAALCPQHRDLVDHQRVIGVRDALIVERAERRHAEIGDGEARHAERRLRHRDAAALVVQRGWLATLAPGELAEARIYGGSRAGICRRQIKIAPLQLLQR